jgi:hypothetical protein
MIRDIQHYYKTGFVLDGFAQLWAGAYDSEHI